MRNTQYAIRNTNQGFTLIELSLVAIIILILVGVSTPLFRRTYNDLQLDETSYSITKFLNYARARAISERVNTKLNFDFELKKYWITINKDPETPNQYSRIEGRLGRFYVIPKGVEINSEDASLNEASVIFYPNGRSGDLQIFLKNKNKKTKLIRVRKETGQASLSDYEEK